MQNRKSIFAEFTKAYDKDDVHIVEGYASTEAVDLDGDVVVVPPEVVEDYRSWANVRYMHHKDAVGVAHDVRKDAQGVYVVAEVVDEDVWKKIKKGVLKGFSLAFDHLKPVWDEAKQAWRKVVTRIVEISVCDRPANPECVFTVVKREDAELLMPDSGKPYPNEHS